MCAEFVPGSFWNSGRWTMNQRVILLTASGLSYLNICCFAQEPLFEAASVKTAGDNERYVSMSGGPGTTDPGRVRFQKVSLVALLTEAFGVQQDQVSGPAWITDPLGPDKYDVVATMATDTTKEQFRMMLMSLLVNRFELAVHHESREAPGYDLVIAKGGAKLINASVSQMTPDAPGGEQHSRSVDKTGWPTLAPGPKTIRFAMNGRERMMFQDSTMADFARLLGAMILNSHGGDSATSWPRVVDKTGLTGNYTFRLEYSCLRCMVKQADHNSGARASEASEPVGVMDLFGVLEKQLGLSLQKAKNVPIDIVVVDHAVKVPTAN